MEREQFKEVAWHLAEISASLRDLVEVGKKGEEGRTVTDAFRIRLAFLMSQVSHHASRLDNTMPAEAMASIRERFERLELAAETVGKMFSRVEALSERLEANEQAVQSCLSTLGEVNKVVQALAARSTGLPGIPIQ